MCEELYTVLQNMLFLYNFFYTQKKSFAFLEFLYAKNITQ